MPPPLLHQFRFSHYNEKARWALDHKRVAHRRRSYLPGMHLMPLLWQSRQRQVPVLRDGAALVVGSAAIVAHLEATHPTPALYPAEPAARQRALEIQDWFDSRIGVPLRAAFFHETLDDPAYMAAVFTHHAGRGVRAVYRPIFPTIAAVMRREMRITPASADEGRARTREGLDFVAANAAATGYLVGDGFSVADLAAAAILGPTVLPPEFPYLPPQPYAAVLATWLARWSDHPGASWVRDIYRRHRGTSAEIPVAAGVPPASARSADSEDRDP